MTARFFLFVKEMSAMVVSIFASSIKYVKSLVAGKIGIG